MCGRQYDDHGGLRLLLPILVISWVILLQPAGIAFRILQSHFQLYCDSPFRRLPC